MKENVTMLSHRDRAILRAVGGGTAELTTDAGTDLFLDGRCCCDQLAARRLARSGLIAAVAPTGPADATRRTASRVPARLTAAGIRELQAC